MKIIEPFHLYLILQLDSVKELIVLIGGFGAISAFILSVILLCRVDDLRGEVRRLSDYESGIYKSRSEALKAAADESARLLKSCLRFAPIPVLFLAINSAIPTTERAAIIFVLPAIANSETVQGEAGELYAIAKRGLERMAEGEEDKPEDAEKAP